MTAFQWLSLMRPFRKDTNSCYISLFTHFTFLLSNDTWCSEYNMDVILPPLGYVNEVFRSHNSLCSNWKMQALKSRPSIFSFALAKIVVNKYLCMCGRFQSLYDIKYIIYALRDICAYETKVTVTFCAEAFQKILFRLGISLECPLFNQDQVNLICA